MKPAKFDYESAATVEEAVNLLGAADGFAKPLAGGQSLGPMMNLRLAQPDLLVDVRRIEELLLSQPCPARRQVGSEERE